MKSMKPIKLMLKLVTILLLVLAVFFVIIWVGIAASGKHVILSKISGIYRDESVFTLDVPSAQRTWTIFVALSKDDLERIRHMRGSIEISVKNSGQRKVHLTTKSESENGFLSRALDPKEKRIIFNGKISDYLANYKYYTFMNDVYYTHSEYDSFFLVKGEFMDGGQLDLVIKSSDDIAFRRQAIVFGFIPTDSI